MTELSADILAAARELGTRLNHTQAVQSYLQAEEALTNDLDLGQLQANVDEVYRDLIMRQRGGEMVFPHEVNEFYKLRDQWVGHPLVKQHEERLQAVKTMFEQASGMMSSILSVDYSELASE